jgi:hemoglobin-like flavoprotein
MSPEQIASIRRSFALVGDRRELVAARFFDHLIESDPSLALRLPADRGVHAGLLGEALAVAVGALDDVDRLLVVLRELGAVHAAHDVRWSEYQAGRTALLLALSDVLGSELSVADAAAWALAYNLLVEAMQQAGEPVSVPEPTW